MQTVCSSSGALALQPAVLIIGSSCSQAIADRNLGPPHTRLLCVCPQVLQIDPKWLVELAPRFFKPADPHRLSRRKRYERIEPLYDKYNDPVAWRLSKRRG